MIVSPKLGSPPLKGEVAFYHASDEKTEGSRGRQQNLKLFEIYFVTFYLYGFSNLLIYHGNQFLKYNEVRFVILRSEATKNLYILAAFLIKILRLRSV